jgi:hypothetical protein
LHGDTYKWSLIECQTRVGTLDPPLRSPSGLRRQTS